MRLAPDHKTIADFRKDNGPAIQAACAYFVVLCRQIGLFGSALLAIDGSKWSSRFRVPLRRRYADAVGATLLKVALRANCRAGGGGIQDLYGPGRLPFDMRILRLERELNKLQDGQYPFREEYYPLAAMVMTEAPPELEAFLAGQAKASGIELIRDEPVELVCKGDDIDTNRFLVFWPSGSERMHLLVPRHLATGLA